VKLRETPRRIDTLSEANPLTGLLFCAECGAKMYNHRKAYMEKPTYKKLTDVYNCSTYKLSNAKFNTKCSPHHISTEAVRTIILEVIRSACSYVREREQEFVDAIRQASAIRQGETAVEYQKQITQHERRLSELDQIFRSLYEDKDLAKLTREIFDQMSGGYAQERTELRGKIDSMQSELTEWNAGSAHADRFVEIVRSYTSFEELTPMMLNEFVEKVIGHEGAWQHREGRPSTRLAHPAG